MENKRRKFLKTVYMYRKVKNLNKILNNIGIKKFYMKVERISDVMKDNIKTEIIVKEQRINVLRIDNKDYISLTDLARYADEDEPRYPIQNWMRNKDVISYLGLWESINNENFKGVEFDTFKNEAGSNKFKMSPQKWIKETNAVGIISKSGNNGGTYARSDIAFEFASWLSPEFKLYLITEFQRLKKKEAYQNKIDWHANRVLAKVSYTVHTDAIKSIIVPTLSEEQKKFVYAEEADVLNVALFGITAKEWRENNPEIAVKGNIRDYTDLLHLVILNNLENINAELIEMKMPQNERLVKLNNIAKKQMELLKNDKSFNKLEYIENKVNSKQELLI